MRQRAKPFQIVQGQLFASPESGRRSHGIEVVEFHNSGGGLVVIAADKSFPQFARTFGHLVGARAIADDVAEVHNHVERWSRGQAGVEGLEVGVNVAKNQYAHGSPDELFEQVADYRLTIDAKILAKKNWQRDWKTSREFAIQEKDAAVVPSDCRVARCRCSGSYRSPVNHFLVGVAGTRCRASAPAAVS